MKLEMELCKGEVANGNGGAGGIEDLGRESISLEYWYCGIQGTYGGHYWNSPLTYMGR